MKKTNKTYKKIIGYCPVDSGQLIIVDPCYLSRWTDGEYNPDDKNGEPQNSYDEACRLTVDGEVFENKQHSIGGVVTSTGFGDGRYPVTATVEVSKEWGVRVKSINIKFY